MRYLSAFGIGLFHFSWNRGDGYAAYIGTIKYSLSGKKRMTISNSSRSLFGIYYNQTRFRPDMVDRRIYLIMFWGLIRKEWNIRIRPAFPLGDQKLTYNEWAAAFKREYLSINKSTIVGEARLIDYYIKGWNVEKATEYHYLNFE